MIRLISKYVKNPLELTRRLIYALIALVGVLAICVVLLCILGPRDIFADNGQVDTEIDLTERSATLDRTLDYGSHYIDSTIFLGDYTTEHMLELEVLSGGKTSYQVWSGENGDIPLDSNIANSSIYIADTKACKELSLLLAERQPERIVITLGISNGVSYCNEEAFKSYYQSLIDMIKESSPNTIIILQSVFPITKKAEKQNPAISNERINTANEWICDIAEDNGVHFLYTASALTDNRGYLNEDYAEDDGINLNYTGYKAVLKYIRTHGTYEQ